jgi:DNA ligase-1
MTDILVELFKSTPSEIIDKVIFLTQGKLHPSWFELPETGIAEKSAIKAVSIATGSSINEIEEKVKELGDLGTAIEKSFMKKKQKTLITSSLTVDKVYSSLDKIAQASGTGSADFKVRNLAGLLANVDGTDGKWILRTVLGKLRIGVADQTIMEALAIAFTGDKSNKQYIEYGYNIHPNLGEIARKLASEGLESIKEMKIEYFTPVRMMLAQRLPSLEEILEKLGGECACEYKYDGERIQAHKVGKEVRLFSRNLENLTSQYPDVCDLVQMIGAENAVIEGECVAIDTETGDLMPFQELMHRRRKYGVKQAQEKYPICLYVFDILKIGEQDLLDTEYKLRRKQLEEIIKETDQIRLATSIISNNPSEIQAFFDSAIEAGCEGIMAKSVQPDSIYQAGARGWIWIKFKKGYQSKMEDSIDVVIVGAYMGRGKRAKSYGALLCAVFNKNEGNYETICKVGSGFTDENLAQFIPKFEESKRETKPPQVTSFIKPEPDIWFDLQFIAEIIGDEITLSNVHPTGYGAIRENSGLSIRFPRFVRWREDKSIEDITTAEEVVEMYKQQIKQV